MLNAKKSPGTLEDGARGPSAHPPGHGYTEFVLPAGTCTARTQGVPVAMRAGQAWSSRLSGQRFWEIPFQNPSIPLRQREGPDGREAAGRMA